MKRQPATRITALALGIAATGILAGCGSTASTSTSTTAVTATSSGAGTGTSQSMTQLTSKLTAGKSQTYKATYAITAPNQNGTLVIERMPPSNSRIDATASGKQFAIISNASTTYVCQLSSTPPQCFSGIQDPLASLEKLVNPDQIIPALQSAAASGSANVTFSTQTIAGMASTCATVNSGQTGTFCVTNQGVLASVSASNGSITLTGFTTAVPASDFAPPAGATVQSGSLGNSA